MLILVQDNVQRLLVYPRLRILDLGVFLVGRINDGRTTHLGHLLAVAEEGPAANLVRADHVLYEQNATTETQREFIEEFDVLQQIVVRGVRVRVLVVVSVYQELDDRLE